MARFLAVEMSADAQDNRPLGWSGLFLTGSFSDRDVADFPSALSALSAGSRATNARPDCFIEAVGQSRGKRGAA